MMMRRQPHLRPAHAAHKLGLKVCGEFSALYGGTATVREQGSVFKAMLRANLPQAVKVSVLTRRGQFHTLPSVLHRTRVNMTVRRVDALVKAASEGHAHHSHA